MGELILYVGQWISGRGRRKSALSALRVEMMGRERSFIIFSVALAFVSFLLFAVHAHGRGTMFYNGLALGASSLAIVANIFIYLKTRYFYGCVGFFVVMTFAIISVRVWETGGVLSPGQSWFLILPVLIYSLLREKGYFLMSVVAVMVSIALLYISKDSSVLAGENSFVSYPIVTLIGFYLITIFVHISEYERRKYLEHVLRKEKSRVIAEMISAYNHEILNPINIARGYLEIYEEDRNELNLFKVHEGLMRIEDIVKRINALNCSDQKQSGRLQANEECHLEEISKLKM